MVDGIVDEAQGNICQYWSVDENGNPIEPGTCPHWDSTIPICTYLSDFDERADFYPYCNLLGTQHRCTQYAGTGYQKRCVRPDPERTVRNRHTGETWVRLPILDEAGEVIEAGDFSAITEYNDGQCDGFGTSARCTGYAPYHLGFSEVQPDDSAGSQGIDLTEFTSISGFEARLPLSFEIYNRRAWLGRCYWWKADPEEFTVDAEKHRVNDVPFRCTNPDEIVNEYSTYKFDFDLNMYRPPCNGCKPECPRYASDICWQYCIDEKMKQGDKVLAEQILELRYYIREHRWDPETYDRSFKYPDIQAWLGSLSYATDAVGTIRYLIPSKRVTIDFDSEHFDVIRNDAMLTEGMPAEDYRDRYPSLVEELNDLVLAPIIKNKFDTIEELNIFGGVQNIFEVTSMTHDTLTIFGKTFYYDADTYAINLSDPEFTFPSYVIQILEGFNSMQEAKANLNQGEIKHFDEMYPRLEAFLNFMLVSMPDKMVVSSLGKQENMFFVDVPTFFGENKVVVLNKGSGRWEFDRIDFVKSLCGGVVAQTSFAIRGEGEVNYLPAYENDFGAYNNLNGEITFQFLPMVSYDYGSTSVLGYIYDDSARRRLDATLIVPSLNDTYELSYRLYKIKLGQTLITTDQMRFIGNAGYVLITMDDTDKMYSRVFKHWEFSDTIYMTQYDTTYDSTWSDVEKQAHLTASVEMEIYSEDNDLLEPNQIILKPVDVSDFIEPCDVFIEADDIYIYEKRSFGEDPSILPPDSEEITESFIGEDDDISYRTDVELDQSGNIFTLTKFGYDPLTISAVLRGLNGRYKGQTKTKMITWVRQPFCRDVEIFYSWYAGYKYYKLLPEYNCYGPTGEEVEINPRQRGYTPLCGDHDLSFFTGTGPMWYPYDDCDSTARYNYAGNLTEYDISVMEVFTDETIDPPHGSHDMRMLGPADKYGETCGAHPHLWDCLCDWSFCNYVKITDNLFGGSAYYRGGLDDLAKQKALRNFGSLPKFGNTYRDFIRSYRSMDNIDYYYWDNSIFRRRRKWVPMYEFYSKGDVTTRAFGDYPYLLYCSTDFYDDGSPFVHPMGNFVVDTQLENIPILETVTFDRYRFEEIFNTHSSVAGLYYPYPQAPEQRLVGGLPVDIISWYTYKDNPSGNQDLSIQWAWQEIWKDLEREEIDLDLINIEVTEYLGSHPVVEELIQRKVAVPYVLDESGSSALLKGRHVFLDILYPDYKYDYELSEHRLVCDEDNYAVVIEPVASGTDIWWHVKFGPYGTDEYGVERCFDMNGDWIDGEDCNKDFYDTITSPPWVSDVTLVMQGSTYTTTSGEEIPDRTIVGFDEFGDETEEYYHRGLDVSVLEDQLELLPRVIDLVPPTDVVCSTYELKLNERTQYATNEWGNLDDLDQFFPAERYLNLTYSLRDTPSGVSITIKLPETIQNLDGECIPYMGVPAIGIDYKFGAIEYQPIPEVVFNGELYHIPAITFSKSNDDVTYTEIGSIDSMKLATKGDDYETIQTFYDFSAFNQSAAEVFQRYNYLKIELRFTPTEAERASVGGDYNEYFGTVLAPSFITISNLYLYGNVFMKAHESINTYERKYRISTGGHGDVPPHGRDSTGSLLYPTPNDKSTVYQYDSQFGMVGLPNSAGELNTMNKVRGRLMKEVHLDKEPVLERDIYKIEEEQKNIHDDVAVDIGSTTFRLASVTPPGLNEKLEEIGITYPSWNCSMTNTIVRPLSLVVRYNRYSPCGHEFFRDLENLERKSGCGKHGYIFWRSTEDVYETVFRRACGEGTGFSSIDALVAYFGGIARVLVNAMVFIGAAQNRFEETSDRIRASQTSTVTQTFPNEVVPLY